MSSPHDSDDRARLDSPGWRLDTSGNFALDLSWDDDSYRWLEVQLDPGVPHHWRLVLHEDADDASFGSKEILAEGVHDPTALLISTEADPWKYDHPPLKGPPA